MSSPTERSPNPGTPDPNTIKDRLLQAGGAYVPKERKDEPPQLVTVAQVLAKWGAEKGINVSGIPTGPDRQFGRAYILAASKSHFLAGAHDSANVYKDEEWSIIRDGKVVLRLGRNDSFDPHFNFYSEDVSTAAILTRNQQPMGKSRAYFIDENGARLVAKGPCDSIKFFGVSGDSKRLLFSVSQRFSTVFNILDTDSAEVEEKFRVKGNYYVDMAWDPCRFSDDLSEVVWKGSRKPFRGNEHVAVFRNSRLLTEYDGSSLGNVKVLVSPDFSRVLTFGNRGASAEILLNGETVLFRSEEDGKHSVESLYVNEDVTLVVAQISKFIRWFFQALPGTGTATERECHLLILRKQGDTFSSELSQSFDALIQDFSKSGFKPKIEVHSRRRELVVGLIQRGKDFYRIKIPFNRK